MNAVHTQRREIRNELNISISKKHSNICTNDYSIKMKFVQVYNITQPSQTSCFIQMVWLNAFSFSTNIIQLLYCIYMGEWMVFWNLYVLGIFVDRIYTYKYYLLILFTKFIVTLKFFIFYGRKYSAVQLIKFCLFFECMINFHWIDAHNFLSLLNQD